MALYETEMETGFYKRQFWFFKPEPANFLTISVPIETEPEFQSLIETDNLKSVYFGLI
jgi:hypothetical protein